MSAPQIMLAAFVSMLASQPALPQSPVKAFTIYQRQAYYGSKPQPPSFEHDVVIARKSDGSYMRAYAVESPDGELGTVVDIMNVKNSSYIHLEPFTKTKSTYSHTESEMANRVHGLTSCQGQETSAAKAESAIMLGFRVVHAVKKQAGETSESWFAPELDCFPLAETYISRTGERTEKAVTRVESGEPSETLFAIPADFVEVSPLQQEALYNAKYPGKSLWEYALQPLADQYFRPRKK